MRVALGLLLLAAVAHADPVRDLISGTSTIPGRDAILKLGDDAPQRLAAFTFDTTLPIPKRERAISLLGVVGGPVTLVTLQSLLGSASQPAKVQTKALETYAKVAGPGELGDLVARGRLLLSHADPEVRKVAIRVLAGTNSPEAAMAMRARQQTEQVPSIRAALAAALGAPQKRARQQAR